MVNKQSYNTIQYNTVLIKIYYCYGLLMYNLYNLLSSSFIFHCKLYIYQFMQYMYCIIDGVTLNGTNGLA